MNKITEIFPPELLRFFRVSHPLFLLGGLILYALGAGLARYLGVTIDWGTYWLGQGAVTMLQLSRQYLNEYFSRDIITQQAFSRSPEHKNQVNLSQHIFIISSAISLTMGSIFTYFLMRNGDLDFSGLIILAATFGITIFYSVPPLHLESTGYGELATAILLANLFPAFAFLLQANQVHRMLAMSTFPLTFLCLAMLLGLSLPKYASDLQEGKRTLLVRIGWQKGMFLHNILLLVGYVLLMWAVLQGYPWALAWPGLLTIPLSIFQIFQMYRISQGAPPRWHLLMVTSLAIFGLTAYLITFALWTD